MDVFYIFFSGKIELKDEKLINKGIYKKHWVIPDKLPGGTIAGGKKWVVNVIIEMIREGGDYKSLLEVAEYFLMPRKIFQGLYEKVISEYNILN